MSFKPGDDEFKIPTEVFRRVRDEIDRYLVMPGQALGYMIGESEILRLRDQAQKKLGDKFEIKDFHDVVLSHGAVPLTVLARLVGEWMDRPAGSK